MKRLASKAEILPISILLLFCLYLFREIVFGGRPLFGIDFNAFYLMMKQFLYDELHSHGSIPYWNPFIFGGIPFWAHFESSIFYPLGFLFWLMPAAKAYGYTMFLHFVLAGFFMYSLVRSLGLNRPGSFVAASIYTCNGFVMPMLYLGHMSPVQSYIWLPAVIYFLNRSLYAPSPFRSVAAAGLLWGAQILAGAPQDAFYTLLASMLFLLFSVRFVPGSSREVLLRVGSTAFLQVIIGAGLAAIQIVPAFEFIGESVRSVLDSYEDVTFGSYPLQGLISVLIPHFFGDPTLGVYWVERVPWSVFQHNLYLGILPLFMTCFISWRRSPQNRPLFYLAFLALFSLALAFGKYTPLYRIALWFPGFDHFRSPARILVLWTFAAAILAGKGTNDFLSSRDRSPNRKSLPWICLLLFVFLLDLGLRWDPAFAMNIFHFFLPPEAVASGMNHTSEMISEQFHRLALLSALSILLILLMMKKAIPRNVGIFAIGALVLFDLSSMSGASIQANERFYTTSQTIENKLGNSIAEDKTIFRVGSFRSDLSPNMEMYWGYQTISGYTALFTHRLYEYLNFYSEGTLPSGWQYFTYGRHQRAKLMDLLNVKYEFNHEAREIHIRKTALPRVFVAPAAEIKPRQDVLPYLSRPDFNPMERIVLETDKPSWPGPDPPKVLSPKPQAELISYRPDMIRVRTSTDAPGYLFLSEMYYPGWKAYVDNTPAKILRGDYLFRVIPIPSGDHSIVLAYRPWTIRLGTGITIFTIVCIAGWGGLRFLRRGTGRNAQIIESHLRACRKITSRS